MNKFVTLYEGHTPDTNILGTNIGGEALLADEDVHRLLEVQGYQVRNLSPSLTDIDAGRASRQDFETVRPHLATTAFHLEVTPPLSTETTQMLAHTLRWVEGFNDGPDRVYLSDARSTDWHNDPLQLLEDFIELNQYGSRA